MKARNHEHRAFDQPKKQSVWELAEQRATNITYEDGKLKGVRCNALYDGVKLDAKSRAKTRSLSFVPVLGLGRLVLRGWQEDDRGHFKARVERAAL